MHRSEYLNGGPEQRVISDRHPADIQHNAIEVEVDALSQFDVGPIIAVERRLDPRCLSARSEELPAERGSQLPILFVRTIQPLAQLASAISRPYEFRVQSIVQF